MKTADQKHKYAKAVNDSNRFYFLMILIKRRIKYALLKKKVKKKEKMKSNFLLNIFFFCISFNLLFMCVYVCFSTIVCMHMCMCSAVCMCVLLRISFLQTVSRKNFTNYNKFKFKDHIDNNRNTKKHALMLYITDYKVMFK